MEERSFPLWLSQKKRTHLLQAQAQIYTEIYKYLRGPKWAPSNGAVCGNVWVIDVLCAAVSFAVRPEPESETCQPQARRVAEKMTTPGAVAATFRLYNANSILITQPTLWRRSGQMELNRAPANESSQNVSLNITSALVSAVLEWMLMFMIFVGASFSYLVTRFARYCQLQTPCLLCLKLDHVLGNEKDSFHWDLFCHNHKLKISSVVLCQHHNNLVDVHGTCETCFFSFATTNKSNAENTDC